MLIWSAQAQTQQNQTPLAQTPLTTDRLPQNRIAFVIGNSAYPSGPLKTAANDAGLIGQTLAAAGFDVVGARDLDAEKLRRSFRDFLDKAEAAGPDAVAMVYLAGYGLQFDGENYLVPVDARINRDVDAPIESVRISDLVRPLSGLPLKGTIVVLDLARPLPFAKSGSPLPGGLALAEAMPRMLVAFNTSPGVVSAAGTGEFGSYALALNEMLREPGLQLTDVFNRTRLRVNEFSAGAEVPWHASAIETPFTFFEPTASAPAATPDRQAEQERRARPIENHDARDAYLAAIERDTLPGYEAFLKAFPRDAMAPRVRAIVSARREAITWRRTRSQNSPDAYWTYLKRYPTAPNSADARRRLARLSAPIAPPPDFIEFDFEVGPPIEEEVVYVSRPLFSYADPDFRFLPPPPPPVYFLPPPPPPIVLLTPIDALDEYELPSPQFVPLPIYARPPVYVAPIRGQPQAFWPGGQPPVGGAEPGLSAGSIAIGAVGVAAAAALALRLARPPSLTGRQGVAPATPGLVQPSNQRPDPLLGPRPGLPQTPPMPGNVTGQPPVTAPGTTTTTLPQPNNQLARPPGQQQTLPLSGNVTGQPPATVPGTTTTTLPQPGTIGGPPSGATLPPGVRHGAIPLAPGLAAPNVTPGSQPPALRPPLQGAVQGTPPVPGQLPSGLQRPAQPGTNLPAVQPRLDGRAPPGQPPVRQTLPNVQQPQLGNRPAAIQQRTQPAAGPTATQQALPNPQERRQLQIQQRQQQILEQRQRTVAPTAGSQRAVQPRRGPDPALESGRQPARIIPPAERVRPPQLAVPQRQQRLQAPAERAIPQRAAPPPQQVAPQRATPPPQRAAPPAQVQQRAAPPPQARGGRPPTCGVPGLPACR